MALATSLHNRTTTSACLCLVPARAVSCLNEELPPSTQTQVGAIIFAEFIYFFLNFFVNLFYFYFFFWPHFGFGLSIEIFNQIVAALRSLLTVRWLAVVSIVVLVGITTIVASEWQARCLPQVASAASTSHS